MIKKKRIFPKKEGAFLQLFMKEFDKQHPGLYWFKVHGEPMMVRGIPDVLCCFDGAFVGLEFKIMRAGKLNVTPYQQDTLERIHKSKGFPFIIWWNERNGNIGIQMKQFTEKSKMKDSVEHLIGEIKTMKQQIYDT